MDLAWTNILESISLAGPHGISWDQFKAEIKRNMKLEDEELEWPPGSGLKYLLESFLAVGAEFKVGKYPQGDHFKVHTIDRDPKTRLMFFVDLEQVHEFTSISDPEDFRFYCSNATTRHYHLFQGRPLQLSDSTLQALEVIAAHGQNGVTQAELAKILGCDSKNAFHWLKGLIANDLIARTPVASNKSFTYLLTLTRYLDEEIAESNGSHTLLLVSSKQLRQTIVDILAKAPGQTMVSKDVFAQAGLDRPLIKHFRRAAAKLNEIGWLEYLFEDQLVGPYCRLFRLKRNPAEGLDLNSFLSAREKAKNQTLLTEQDQLRTPRGHQYNPGHPIPHQLILLLARAYPEPLTTNQLSHHLNISRKYLYKLIERILPVSDKKAGVAGAEGVEKVSDFVGKEKRLRLFVKSEEWRDYYLNLFSNASSSIKIDIDPGLISVSSSSRPSTPLTVTSSSAAQSPSVTRTRQLRHQIIISELAEKKVLEVGKDLCQRIQELLGDTRFTLDVKTLRRSVEILEREGHLKVVIATIPQGTRALLLSPELSASDEIVQNHIAKLNEFVRTGSLSANTQKLNRLKEAMQGSEYFVEGSIPLGIPQNPSVNTRALTQFGFVHGVLSRAQLFHQYLLSKQRDFSFETIPTVFDQIPLHLYLKLIGIVRMSKGLFDSLNTIESTPLINLPEEFREELSLNRKRFQSQAAILLNTLEQLKIIEGEDHFSSLNFRIPLKYNLAKNVPLYDHRGQVQRFIDTDAFDDFWKGMHDICTNYHSMHTASIYEDAVEDELVPKPVLLARHADSWKQKPGRERDLERAVKKFAFESFSLSKSKRPRIQDKIEDEAEIINSLSKEFQVPVDRIKQMVENYLRLLEEREEAKRLDKLATRKQQRSRDFVYDESDSGSDSDGLEHLRWTSSDWSKLSLAFCVLQHPPFLSNSNPGIKWNLVTRIFDKPKSPVVIRRHGLKLFKSYRELKRMLELDTIVSLVMRRNIDLNTFDLSDLFKTVFESCQRIVSDSEDDEIFDSFKQIENDFDFIVLPARQDHFLDTIDTWVQTRSFRHGLFLNDSGLQKTVESDSLPIELECDNHIMTVLRQILVTSTTEHFNFDATLELINGIDPESLSTAINHLISSGFASRNRSKDKTRLFGSPLAISEAVREVVECSRESVNQDTFAVDCETETLSMKRIEEIISKSPLITLKSFNNTIKFDCPIEIKPNLTSSSHFDLSALQNSDCRAIWFTSTKPHLFLPSIAIGCLNHLEAAIKSKPGVSVHILGKRYIPILGGSQFLEALIESLLKSGRVELIESKYLQ